MEQQLAAFESPTSPYSTDRTSISITSRSAIRIVLTPVVSQVAADVLDCLVVVSLQSFTPTCLMHGRTDWFTIG